MVGCGPAGLQAALTLGRVHRDVVLVDAGEGRNAPSAHLHNLVTRDRTPPAEFRRLAREELAAYPPVSVRDGHAVRVATAEDADAESAAAADAGRAVDADGASGTADVVELADGTRLAAPALVLATRVRDELPDVPGLAGLWGDRVAHCPFCHGHELARSTARRARCGSGGAPAGTARPGRLRDRRPDRRRGRPDVAALPVPMASVAQAVAAGALAGASAVVELVMRV